MRLKGEILFHLTNLFGNLIMSQLEPDLFNEELNVLPNMQFISMNEFLIAFTFLSDQSIFLWKTLQALQALAFVMSVVKTQIFVLMK